MTVRNRATASAAGVLIGCLVGLPVAQADHRPVIALPGHPEVPVVIDGFPATGALVEGDWGLYAPGRVVPRVYPPALFAVEPVLIPVAPDRGYYPKAGRRPRYGRHEDLTPRPLPRPAPSFYREWSIESADGPVTDYPPYQLPWDYWRGGDNMDDSRDSRFRPTKRRGGRIHRGPVPQSVLPQRGGHL